MPVELIFLIVGLLMISFLALGLYIHSILLLSGIIGIVLLESPGYVTGFLQSDPFIRVASYSLTTIPLFVLMAQFIVRSGIIEDLFTIIYNISKGRKGILGILTVFSGGMLGAVSGSSNASAAAMGQVAVPQLIKRGYSEGIAGATAAAAGSLSSVIPPSIVLILWGVATETPIGQLFIASLIPGIIIMVVISVSMLIFLKRADKHVSSEDIKPFEKESVPVKRASLAIILIGLIAVSVFYGIYAGIFTPTEAGAVGAMVSFITALLLRRVNISFIVRSFSETVKLTAMILLIMIGAQIFGRFVSLSLLPREIINLLSGLIEYPVLILIILCLIYFVLFMFIEGAAVILMTAPIVLPLINTMQVDTVWFGVIVGILCTIGLLTPPVGLSIYSVSGVTGIKSEKIFQYALPYSIIIAVVVCGLLILFPQLVTWLPERM
ncbi:TRAP transporter large permease [Alkalicoccus daliensis]|uniref:TRAP transporter, DctM subunit n=1 Tax=Alkalicoccus daliensis TaxID=745820 RepID=A0A1H0J001_9BACI|nr:TRAP transporter large permease [Alkalicoccus daliensis]SDO36893.1 TRAP transporter, DctM subunit [Alkalicoccus daliensis]